ncbi:MAG: hypothetical protein KBT50_03745, partial [Cycloclasticus sp.]|nr:hypothetical protein [Cycloclasticus sp.]MBQ0789708.1 hypothetical protein [Cycloclasticus sp.]
APIEDSFSDNCSDSLESTPTSSTSKLNVVVPIYPRVSNHTDLDPLAAHPQVDLQLVGPSITNSATNSLDTKNARPPIPAADLVILPGSKNTRADLEWLKEQGWLPYLQQHLRYGGKILGICGGLQMLGNSIHDPLGLEGDAGSSEGFGWLNIETELLADKTLKNVSGQLNLPNQPACDIQGYEIHAGLSINASDAFATHNHQSIIATRDQHICGLLSDDQQIMASYWHGLMDTPESLQAIMRWAGSASQVNAFRQVDYQQLREHSLEILAATIEEHFDWQKLVLALDKFHAQ